MRISSPFSRNVWQSCCLCVLFQITPSLWVCSITLSFCPDPSSHPRHISASSWPPWGDSHITFRKAAGSHPGESRFPVVRCVSSSSGTKVSLHPWSAALGWSLWNASMPQLPRTSWCLGWLGVKARNTSVVECLTLETWPNPTKPPQHSSNHGYCLYVGSVGTGCPMTTGMGGPASV